MTDTGGFSKDPSNMYLEASAPSRAQRYEQCRSSLVLTERKRQLSHGGVAGVGLRAIEHERPKALWELLASFRL